MEQYNEISTASASVDGVRQSDRAGKAAVNGRNFPHPPPPHAHRTDLKPHGFQGLRRLLRVVLPVVALVVFSAPETAQAVKTITLSAVSTTITEGDSGKTDVVITVTLGQSTTRNETAFEIVFVDADSTATNNTNTNTNSCNSPSPANADICYVGAFSDNTDVVVTNSATGSFTLGILGDEDVEPNETIKLKVRGVPGLNDGWTAGEITLTITNDDTRPTATAVPAKPTGLTGTELSGQVTLTWTDPGDATITKWQYLQKAGSAAWGTNWMDIPGSVASTTEHTITGLTDGTEYSFRVRAVNDFGGAGAGFGAQSDVFTITPELVKPVLTVSATADGEAVLSWTVPDGTLPGELITGGVELTQWNWRFRLKGEQWPATGSITPRTSEPNVRTYTHDYNQEYPSVGHTFPKVPNGAVVEYQVHVVGRNVAGGVASDTLVFGPWSNIVEATVIHTALPALNFTPSSLTVRKGRSASYTVALTTALAGTLSITSSDTAKATVDPATLTFTTGNYNTAQMVTVTGVDAGSAAIRHAFTRTGASAPLIADAGQLPVTVTVMLPEAPTGLSVEGGNEQLTLSWDDPADASITGYQFRQRQGTGDWGDWTAMSGVGATTTTYTVTGLTNDVEYHFRIRAVNADGTGPASGRAKGTPTNVKPNIPVLTAVAGDGEVSLSWTSQAGIATWGYQYQTSAAAWTGVATTTVREPKAVVTGLTNRTEYKFRVFARFANNQSSTWSDEATATPTPMLKVPAMVTVAEGGGNATVPVTVGDPVGQAVTLNVTYGGSSATGASDPANGDYDNDAATTVSFSATDRTKNIVIPITDDAVDEEDETFTVTIAVAASTPLPSGFSLGNAMTTVTIADNDTDGVVLSVSELTVEEGGTGTYTVQLGTLPPSTPGTVTVTPSSDALAVATVAPATLTFTTANWNEAQMVTVTALEDDDADAGTASISHAVTGYGAVTAGPVLPVTVGDDEQLSVSLRQTHDGSVHAFHAQFGQSMLGVANDIIVSRTGDLVSTRSNGLRLAGRQIPLAPTAASAVSMRPDRAVEWTRHRVDSALDLLAESSFNLSLADGSSGEGLTFWGRGGQTSFKRNSATRTAEGRVTVGGLGVELSGGDWLGGLAYFRTRGKGNTTTTSNGDTARSEEALTMNSVHPYVHWQATEAVEVWGTLGYGKGRADSDLVLAANNIEYRKGRVELLSALMGTRLAWRPEWSLKGEVMASETTTKGLSATTMKSSQQQYKAVLEWSRPRSLSDGGELRPKLEAGVRYDDDDHGTGLNLLVAGSMHYTDADGRWSWQLGGSVLQSRASRRYRERGVYVGVELRARANDVGPSLSITATQGVAAEAQQATWAESSLDDGELVRDGDDGVDTRFEFGYGRPWGAGHLKPKVSLVLPATGAPVYATGLDYRHRDHLSIGLALIHRPQMARGDGIRLTGTVHW